MDGGGGESKGGEQRASSLFFVITCFLESLWRTRNCAIERAELINNNAALTYTYPNTIKTCLTPNQWSFLG